VYREHFGLVTNPFGIAPRLDFLYKSGAFAESMAHLVYGLENSEAIVMITGAIGTGKTMAVQSFLAHLGDGYVTALVTNTNVDAAGLLKLVLDDLGHAPPAGADKSDLLIAFKQLIIEMGREGRHIVVVIDEAQNLGREVLEELRLLTNLGQGDEQPVQIVLVGQPELEAAVARPDLAQLRQRIRVHYKLSPLTRAELAEYVDHRMTVAGGEEGVFTRGALDRIFAASGGVPRVVNTLCGDALLAAFVAGRGRVEAPDVETEGDADRYGAAPAADEGPRAAEPPAAAAAEPVRPAMAERRPVPPAATPRQRAASRSRGRSRVEGAGKSGRRARRWWLVLLLVAALAAGTWATHRVRGAWPWQAVATESPGPTERAARPDGDADARPVAIPAVATRVPPATVADSLGAAKAQPATGAPADSSAGPPAAKVVEPAPADARPKPATIVAGATSVPRRAEGRPAARDTSAMPTAVSPVRRADTGSWYLHVSSFHTAEHAAQAAAEFTARGLEATTRSQDVAGTTWWRVYLGPFGDRQAAVERAEALRGRGDITYYKLQQLAANAP
jgi:type II secretory pathway predicted ATPase ExeA/cell division protein FtsN